MSKTTEHFLTRMDLTIQTSRVNQQRQEEQSMYDDVRQRNKVRIKTQISKREVEFRNEFPTNEQEREIFKYSCPICLRYFNKMLVSSCCQNYICRFCIGEMAKRAKKDKQFIIKCSHCLADDFKLDDVKPGDTVKFYSDTPFKFLHKDQKLTSNSSNASPSKLDDSKRKFFQNILTEVNESNVLVNDFTLQNQVHLIQEVNDENQELSQSKVASDRSCRANQLYVGHRKNSDKVIKSLVEDQDGEDGISLRKVSQIVITEKSQQDHVSPIQILRNQQLQLIDSQNVQGIEEEFKEPLENVIEQDEQSESRTVQVSPDKNVTMNSNTRQKSHQMQQPFALTQNIIQSSDEQIAEYAKNINFDDEDIQDRSSLDMRHTHKNLEYLKIYKKSIQISPSDSMNTNAQTHIMNKNSIFKSLGKQISVTEQSQHKLNKAISQQLQNESNKENVPLNVQDMIFTNTTTPVLTSKMKVRLQQMNKRNSIQSDDKKQSPLDFTNLQDAQRDYIRFFQQRNNSTPISEKLKASGGKVKLRKSELLLNPPLNNQKGSKQDLTFREEEKVQQDHEINNQLPQFEVVL